ncbi:helix-turn-helix domain-containing protein [Brevundimonas faecalis]|uniref:helix-turn-helix domain-containing protein n=1 Tax=Brevundimonas faecalis TaxID=947378 RepID=UPI00361ED482
MTVAVNRNHDAQVTGFATARRGGLNGVDIAFIREQRRLGRGWQTIAQMMGRPRADLVEAVALEAATTATPKVFVWTPERRAVAGNLFRRHGTQWMLAAEVGCSLDEAAARLDVERAQALAAARERAKVAAREKRRANRPPTAPKPKRVKPPKPVPVQSPVSDRAWATTLTRPLQAEAVAGPTPLEVAIATAEACGLNLVALCRKSKETHRAHARWIASWAMRKYCPGISYPEIGLVLGGLDHSTVMYGVRNLEALIERGQYHDVLHKLADRFSRSTVDGQVAVAMANLSAALAHRADVLRRAA